MGSLTIWTSTFRKPYNRPRLLPFPANYQSFPELNPPVVAYHGWRRTVLPKTAMQFDSTKQFRTQLVAVAIAVLTWSGVTSAQDESDQAYQALAEMADRFEKPYSLIRQIVKTTQPVVAHIEAKKTQKTAAQAGTGSTSRTAVIEEAGSGIVYRYRNRNFVITNFHVIEDSEVADIRIEADGKAFYPTHVEHDPATDLSVLFVDQSTLDACRIGNSEQVAIGDFVVAVGSPFGLSHSVSYGIISAMGRRDLELGPQGVRYQDFFQTDAAINPGNSGAPLLNLRGEVIGINTAIASNSGGCDGIGFAIPIRMVERIAQDLIDYGVVKRGFLGVSLDARYTADRGRIIGLDLAYGTRVSGITANSPAEKADFQVGDIILEYNGIRVASDSHLVTEVSLTKIGENVPVKIYRAGKFKTLVTTIEDRTTYQPGK